LKKSGIFLKFKFWQFFFISCVLLFFNNNHQFSERHRKKCCPAVLHRMILLILSKTRFCLYCIYKCNNILLLLFVLSYNLWWVFMQTIHAKQWNHKFFQYLLLLDCIYLPTTVEIWLWTERLCISLYGWKIIMIYQFELEIIVYNRILSYRWEAKLEKMKKLYGQ
jgi:hypothetical protein